MKQKLKIKGKDYDVDEDGYLLDSGARDKDWHEHVLKEEGLTELTDEHNHVLEKLAIHRDKHGTLPTAADLSRATGMKIRYMHELFPTGPGRAACKILGLPPTDGLVMGRLPRSDRDRSISKAKKITAEYVDYGTPLLGDTDD